MLFCGFDLIERIAISQGPLRMLFHLPSRFFVEKSWSLRARLSVPCFLKACGVFS